MAKKVVKKHQQLTIYSLMGKTLRFEKVKNFKITEGVVDTMTFDYTSASQGSKHTAKFDIDLMLGYSLLKD